MSRSAGGTDSTAPSAASRVAAVVVNFESGKALTECLRTVVSEAPAEVVVVDNGSTDGSVAHVGRDFPGVEVVVPGRNLGYGAAANRGAAATTAELILVCNSDLSLHPGVLAPLVALLDDQPDTAVTGPLIRTPAGDRYPSARRFPSLIDAGGHALLGLFLPNNPFTRNYQRSDMDVAADTPQRVDWLSGACLLVRRSAFESVGGFDEAYFMYAEDADLCWRLARAGWGTMYVPTAEVLHIQGVSTDHHPYRMIVEHHRSLLRFAWRSTDGWRRLLLPLVAVGIGVRALLACTRRLTR